MAYLDIASYNLKGQAFVACNQAGATVTLINTSTATGFILSNTWGSTKKLVLTSITFAYSTVPAATAVVFWAVSVAPSQVAHATTTAIQVYAADGSGARNDTAGKAYSVSTTPNLPVYSRIIGYSPTTPATSSGLTWTDRGEGAIVLVPGSYGQISYLGAAPVGVTSVEWIEVPQ